MNESRAISDTMGVMLVAVVVLSTAAAAGVGIIAYQEAQTPSDVNAAVSASVDGENLTVRHLGGDAMERSTIEIVARGAETHRFAGRDASVVTGDSDDLFEPGERWRWRAGSPLQGDVEVLLVEAGERAVVDTAALRAPWQGEVDEPPTASFTVSNSAPSTGEVVTFDASESSDPEGEIASYDWDFDGDGTWDATGRTASRQYPSTGPVTVRLRVVDEAGNVATTSRQLTVGNQPPVVDVQSSCAGLTCSFSANATDPDVSVTDIEWTFGDGSSGSGASVTHEYAQSNTYEVTVTVQDDTGATTSRTRTVTPDGTLRFVTGEAVRTGQNGKNTAVQIQLENQRASQVRIIAVSVSVSKQHVNAVSGDGYWPGPFRSEFYVATTRDGYADPGWWETYPTGTRLAMSRDAVLDSQATATVTISEFGRARTRCRWFYCWEEFSAKNVPGATVTFEVWLADGTHRTYSFKA